MQRLFSINLLLLLINCILQNTVFAHEYVKLPVLVNLPGFKENPPSDPSFENEFSVEALDNLKSRIIATLQDTNKVLEQCSKTHGTAKLQLGDPDKGPPKNIVFINKPNGNKSPNTQEELNKDAKEGKKELEARFKKLSDKGKKIKGQKINVVQGGLLDEETPARGQLSEPVLWIKESSLNFGSGFGSAPPPISGPYIVHEMLHNAGLKDHTTEDGNVLNIPTELGGQKPDRQLTACQCEKLQEYFKEYGVSQPNKEQETGYIFEPDKTHYALLTIPESEIPTDTHIGIIEYSIGENQHLFGKLTWDHLITREKPVNLSLQITINDLSPSFIEINVSGKGDGQLFIEGSIQFGEKSGEFSRSLNSLSLVTSDIEDSVNDFVLFETQLARVTDHEIPIETSLVNNFDSEKRSFPNVLTTVPPSPELVGLPISAPPGKPISICGSNFSPDESILLFVGKTEVSLQKIDGTGFFSDSIIVPDFEEGDYIIEAVDANGIFAIGILTILGSPRSKTFYVLILSIFLLLVIAFYLKMNKWQGVQGQSS